MELICTVCDGLGQERREITHPATNVAGWHREGPYPSNWYRRRCEKCEGTGFVEAPRPSVPLVGKP